MWLAGSEGHVNGGGSGSDAGEAPPDGHVHTINGAKSGTRLKLGWVQTADGMRHLTGTSLDYYDSMRAVDCRATVWADGKTYCTPSHGVAEYTDATCSTPVFVTSTGTTPPTYIADFDAVGRTLGMYTPGATTTSIPTYTRVGTTCMGPSGSLANTVYTLTPVTDLVELTRAFPGTGTLHESWYESAAPRYHEVARRRHRNSPERRADFRPRFTRSRPSTPRRSITRPTRTASRPTSSTRPARASTISVPRSRRRRSRRARTTSIRDTRRLDLRAMLRA